MFTVPKIFDIGLSIITLFLGTTIIVFLSNNITGLIESMTPLPLPLLLSIHLNIICFLYHFLRCALQWMDIQMPIYKFDQDVYADTAIIVGPTLGMTSTYLKKFIQTYNTSRNFFINNNDENKPAPEKTN